jgi:hypothetical protein
MSRNLARNIGRGGKAAILSSRKVIKITINPFVGWGDKSFIKLSRTYNLAAIVIK